MEARNTVPTRMPVTPSMTVVPDTRDLTFHVCGGTSGFAALLSRSLNATARTADVAKATRTRCGEPAVLLGGAEAVDERGEAADDGGGTGHVELLEGDARAWWRRG